jgi:hypothetical protein
MCISNSYKYTQCTLRGIFVSFFLNSSSSFFSERWKTQKKVAQKYLRKSPARLFKFGKIAIELGISTKKSLCSDMKTRWNSTHHMLQSVLYYKSTFQRYAVRDSNFEWLPSEIEWIRGEKLIKLLDVFTNISNIFSGTSYPACNLYFNEVFKVKNTIFKAYTSSDGFLKDGFFRWFLQMV